MTLNVIEHASGQVVADFQPHSARRSNKSRSRLPLSPLKIVTVTETTNPQAVLRKSTNLPLPAGSQSSPEARSKLSAKAWLPTANGTSGPVRFDPQEAIAAKADGRAIANVKPRPVMPVPTGQDNSDDPWPVAGGSRAEAGLSTIGAMPALIGQSSNEIQAGTAGDGRANRPLNTCKALPDLIGAIRELYAQRRAAIRMQLRIDNQCRALARRGMGWRFDMPEKERAKVNADAAALVDAIQSGGEVVEAQAPIADALRPFCLASLSARKPFDAMRTTIEKELRSLARQLPVWRWAETVKGFGELGLATIVGEAGDLSNYGNPAKVWKRFGLHVDGGAAAKNRSGEVGHSAARRSASWVIADSLLRQDNSYSRLYRERRAYEMARNPDFDKGVDAKTGKQKVSMHCDRRARRYAEKRFLRDLWRGWRDTQGENK